MKGKTEKETAEKLYSFGMKDVYSLKIPKTELSLPPDYDEARLIIKAAIAGLLYNWGEKDKALSLYKQTIEDEFKRLPLPFNEKTEYTKLYRSLNFIHLQSMYCRTIEILMEQNQFDEALTLIEKGVKIFPRRIKKHMSFWIDAQQ